MTVSAPLASPSWPTARHQASGNGRAAPAAFAVDLGSCTARVWAARHGTVNGRCGDESTSAGTLVRRGRVVDIDGCVDLLLDFVHRYPQPVATGGVVVACRPVLASEAEQNAIRRVLDAVFVPTRVLFVDTVRAAAVGAGAAAGTLLVVDVGAELTEVAVLQDGRVIAARRTEIGTRDLTQSATVDHLSDTVVRHIDDLRAGAHAGEVRTALVRGMLLVGDGALHPQLVQAISSALGVRVHRAVGPRTVALHGAGLAAMSLLRHPIGG